MSAQNIPGAMFYAILYLFMRQNFLKNTKELKMNVMNRKIGILLMAGATFGVVLAGSFYTPREANREPLMTSAEFPGRNGPVRVAVETSGDEIISVQVTDQQETTSIASEALNRIPAEIIKSQSIKLDTVSGATITSNAILQAAGAALDEAGIDVASMPQIQTQAGEDVEAEADVIIVGGGGAGLAAATEALDNGVSVILIEKTSMLGGNTVISGGVFNEADPDWASENEIKESDLDTLKMFADMKAEDFPEEYREDFNTLKKQIEEYLASESGAGFDSPEYFTIQTYYYGHRTGLDGSEIGGDYTLVSTLAQKSSDTFQWLTDLGVEWSDQISSSVWPRGRIPVQDKGQGYISALEEKILAKGGQVMYETTGKSLITDQGGRVTGVNALRADGTKVTLKAQKGVILATGGYAHNLEMIKENDNYWGNFPDNIGTTNAAGSDGSGILMARETGAATTGMGYVQLMAIADPVTGDLFTGILPQSYANYIFVNGDGKRFVNECGLRDTLSSAAIENGGLFYMIADSRIADNLRSSTWQEQVDLGNALMADTLEELADLMGYDQKQKENFLNTIETYNTYVDAGEDPEFGKTDLDLKVEEGPFFATPRRPAIHHTMGGLVINENAQVLDENGDVIKGLFAAGEVTGGIHAGNRVGGNAITDVMTYGRIAGQNAAKG